MSQSLKVRLLKRVKFNGLLFDRGVILSIPRADARRMIRLGLAEMAGPEHAVTGPEETR